jgi:hypothetical protein
VTKPAGIGAVRGDDLLQALVGKEACFRGRHDLGRLPNQGAIRLSMHEIPVVLSQLPEVGAAAVLQRDEDALIHAPIVPSCPIALIG